MGRVLLASDRRLSVETIDRGHRQPWNVHGLGGWELRLVPRLVITKARGLLSPKNLQSLYAVPMYGVCIVVH
jgi:hypothetical protein